MGFKADILIRRLLSERPADNAA